MYCTQVGGTLYFYFATVDTAGEIANADSTPTATLHIDGVAQGTSPTLAHPPAVDGAYVGSFSLAGRSVGQAVAVLVTATVDGVEGNHWIIGGPITRDADGAVITDTASRDASKADVSGLATPGDVTLAIVSFVPGSSSAVNGGLIRLAQGEGRTWTITHSGLDLTGATLRFTVWRQVSAATTEGEFELQGADVVGGDGESTVDFSSTETANVLGEGYYWDLWEDPDDAEDSIRHATGKFRVALAMKAVS